MLVDHTVGGHRPQCPQRPPRCRFRRCPDLGGQAGAENGVLTVMCGGDQADFDRVAPVIDAYSRACNLLGGPGSGQLTKMVNRSALPVSCRAS